MAQKHIYLIRHGETIANRTSVHQGPEEPLSELGQKQAHTAARVLKTKKFDTLLCSTYVRARQTAEIIGEELGLPFTQIESVVEFRRPNKLYRKSHFSLGSLMYISRLFFHRENPNWNDDGAENMFSVRNRVADAKNELASIEGENIIVVSHAIFMDMFLTLACMEEKLTVRQFIGALLNIKKTPNTGIIHLTYDENISDGICQWQLVEFINPNVVKTLA